MGYGFIASVVILSSVAVISTLAAVYTVRQSRPCWDIPPFTSTTTLSCWSEAMSDGPTIPAVWAMRKPDSHMVYFDCPHCGKTHFLDTRKEIHSDGSASVYCKERDSEDVVQHTVVINHIFLTPRKS